MNLTKRELQYRMTIALAVYGALLRRMGVKVQQQWPLDINDFLP